jgi:large subunit ribosomal protein L5
MVARFKQRYDQEIVPRLMQDLGATNRMAVPRLAKIVVNMGVGRAVQDKKLIDEAAAHLATVTGQRGVVTKARTAVSGFKIREGYPIGVKVTLRGTRMYEFFDRLVSVALPRVRDFRGLDPKAMDGHGNYTLGIGEVSVFPEVDLDSITFPQGMDVTIVTTAKTDAGGLRLLELFGMPFRREAAGAPSGQGQDRGAR